MKSSCLWIQEYVVFVLQVDPCIRSMMALQEERGSTSYSELQNEVTKRSLTRPLDSKPPVLRWSRLPGQVSRRVINCSAFFSFLPVLTIKGSVQ